jgi:hypothetical protein
VRRITLVAVLLFAPALAWAAEPVAKITGPTSAMVGDRILLDVSGSASDPDMPLQVQAIGPEQPSTRVWFDEAQKPGLVVMTAGKPGTYILIVIATGTVGEKPVPTFRFASWAVTVAPVGPAPKPPAPDPPTPPGPVPPPQPPPGPTPVQGRLWGMLVIPGFPSVGEASLRTNRNVRQAFADNKIFFSSYLNTEPETELPDRKGAIAAVGGPPCILWIDETGKIIRATKVMNESTIIADARAIRGAK